MRAHAAYRAQAALHQSRRSVIKATRSAGSHKSGGSRWILAPRLHRLHRQPPRLNSYLAIIRQRVKPFRETNRRKARRERWWLFGEQAVGMRRAIAGQDKYIASLAFGKRLLISWQDKWTCPSGKIYIFAFDDDYSMGILSSLIHGAWAWNRGATLKADLSYTPTSVFETFAWPYPVADSQQEEIAEASREVMKRRGEICAENHFGLTALYNLVDDGAYADLKNLQRKLDEAVAEAYGWPKAMTRDSDEVVRRLLKLNQEITAGTRIYDPFGPEAGAPMQLPMSD